jgi:hypothetical protein
LARDDFSLLPLSDGRVGCPIAPFETLAEVAVIYGLDLECFLNELRQTIRVKEDVRGYKK